MHPIERLRAVARTSGADPVELVDAAARALAGFADDPAGLVAAARRMVARHPAEGRMWWACSRIVVAPDPVAEAQAVVADLGADPTADLVVPELPDDATALVVGWPEVIVGALARRGDVGVLAVDDGTGTDLGRLLSRVEVEVDDVPAEGAAAAVLEADLVLLEAGALGPDEVLAPPGSLAVAATAAHHGVPTWLVAPVGVALPAVTYAACRAAALGPSPAWARGLDPVPRALAARVLGEAVVAPVAPELLRSSRTPGSHEP